MQNEITRFFTCKQVGLQAIRAGLHLDMSAARSAGIAMTSFAIARVLVISTYLSRGVAMGANFLAGFILILLASQFVVAAWLKAEYSFIGSVILISG